MAENTRIEWADTTWNPVVGCTVKSPGCKRCYAMRMAARLEAMGQEKYKGLTKKVKGKPVWTGKIGVADEKTFAEPLRWKRPRNIFVNSMGDLFHENVTDESIDRVFAVMALCPQHTFAVLTKWPERSAEYLDFFTGNISDCVGLGGKSRLETAAEKYGRSMNSEIVQVLKRKYPANRYEESVAEKDLRIAELESANTQLRGALTEISSPTQTTALLWWQLEARKALKEQPPHPLNRTP